MTTREPILLARSLSKSFGSGAATVQAVRDVTLAVQPGELVLIMGPSGSGKTTLLSMLGALLRPTAGSIFIDGTEITALGESALPDIRARKIGFIFQAFNLMEALTVTENVLFPARLISQSAAAARARAHELIEALGLAERRHALPATLSGGEKQRVAIARALINGPKLVLADEPTGNLDSQSGQDVMMILHDIARDEGCAVVLVTHDARVEDVADRVLWLEDGSLRDRKREHHAWTRCPVCRMRVDEWIAAFEVMHESTRYVFCSKRCHERFVANPSAYVISL